LAAAAQGARGAIAGRLTERVTAWPVVNARVDVLRDGRPVASTLSDQSGAYRLKDLPAGTYAVVISALGVETRRIPGVEVVADRTAELSVPLVSAAIELNPVVVTASRKSEKALDAPATVAVVDERSVAERPTITPVDHLRETPGVDVFNSGVQSTNVVVRGFNNIFSGAVMALADYRIASLPSLRVNYLHFLPANDQDVARMEVVLGPASALYGPNTANGVIHVITRSPLDAQGTTVTLGGGGRSLFQATFRSAQRIGERFGIKVSGQYLQAQEVPYVDPVEVAERAKFHGDTGVFNGAFFRGDLIAATRITGEEADRRIALIGARDNDILRYGGELRADWRPDAQSALVLQGGVTDLARGIELTGLSAAQAKSWSSSYAQVRFSRGRLFAQTYVNASDAGDTYLLRNGAPISDRSRMYVAQLQHGVQLGWENLTYGTDLVVTNPITNGTIDGIYEDHDQTTELGGYLQTETTIGPRLNLVLAGRLDHSSAIPDLVFSPRAGLVFKPAPAHAFRLTYNRAFSTPTSINQFLDLGTPFLNPELAQLAQLGYSLRIQGTGRTGFHFRQPGGGYLMVLPFTSGQQVPADAASGWAAAVQAVAAGDPALQQNPQLLSYLAGLKPTPNEIGLMWETLDSLAAKAPPAPLSSLDLRDIPRNRESVSSTFEAGYQGVWGGRLLVTADAWHKREDRMTTPLTPVSPLLYLNQAQTLPYLEARLIPFFQAAGSPPNQAQAQAYALAAQLTPYLASVPVGAITAPEVDAQGAQLLTTYRNVDDVLKVYGADFAVTYLLTGTLSLRGTLALVNKDVFRTERGDLVTLNAPRTKGTLSITYRNEAMGFDGEVRGRYTASFPVISELYNGTTCRPDLSQTGAEPCVGAYTLLDLDLGYALPHTAATLQLAVQNLLGESYRSFPGVPALGRMGLLRLKYGF
jgi:iron complex outermembrane receptor protein